MFTIGKPVINWCYQPGIVNLANVKQVLVSVTCPSLGYHHTKLFSGGELFTIMTEAKEHMLQLIEDDDLAEAGVYVDGITDEGSISLIQYAVS
jgi:hypothetical protein